MLYRSYFFDTMLYRSYFSGGHPGVTKTRHTTLPSPVRFSKKGATRIPAHDAPPHATPNTLPHSHDAPVARKPSRQAVTETLSYCVAKTCTRITSTYRNPTVLVLVTPFSTVLSSTCRPYMLPREDILDRKNKDKLKGRSVGRSVPPLNRWISVLPLFVVLPSSTISPPKQPS